MRSSGIKQRQTEQLLSQGYFSLSSDERAEVQQNSFSKLHSLRDQIKESAKAYAKEVRKDGQ